MKAMNTKHVVVMLPGLLNSTGENLDGLRHLGRKFKRMTICSSTWDHEFNDTSFIRGLTKKDIGIDSLNTVIVEEKYETHFDALMKGYMDPYSHMWIHDSAPNEWRIDVLRRNLAIYYSWFKTWKLVKQNINPSENTIVIRSSPKTQMNTHNDLFENVNAFDSTLCVNPGLRYKYEYGYGNEIPDPYNNIVFCTAEMIDKRNSPKINENVMSTFPNVWDKIFPSDTVEEYMRDCIMPLYIDHMIHTHADEPVRIRNGDYSMTNLPVGSNIWGEWVNSQVPYLDISMQIACAGPTNKRLNQKHHLY
jgi:hypothetical protein